MDGVAKGRGGREVQVSVRGDGAAAVRGRPVPDGDGKQACSQMT